ncbi:SusC/RagA family TonB-linked outer membrane protein [Roseimarinus sediminis]|uniref:SusC/RagA family TonB-linked outer membrane protein n=1 Tax=Roseimarinus sediminis TaxID=1610899 RepID=UPI003D1A2B09
MQKRTLLTTILLLSSFVVTFAQQQITGRITSSEDKQGIPGVNVVIKGTSAGTITDIDGNFSLKASVGDTLNISFVGMQPATQAVGNETYYAIVLNPLTEKISDVIVTALGLKREEKALGYAVQNVKGEQVAKVKELDVINALSGKLSGVNIIQGDGAIGGGGSRIVIRGESSLAGNNDPLFIINGVRGSANDVAADDIESISVLKGPAAAALYGSEAGGGVVIITSKSGKGSKGITVEVNSNSTFQSPLILPEYQNKYGMGESGEYSYYDGNGKGTFDDTRYNWGPAFDGEPRNQFTGYDPWVAYPNNVKDFYETGHVYVNNVSLSQANENGNMRFSYTNTDQKGIMPNTGLTKNRFDLSTGFKMFDKLTFNANLNYLRTYCPNNRQVDVRFIPRSIDISALKDYWIPGLEGYQQMNYRRSANNPYFVQYEMPFSYTDSKVILNMQAQYDITKHLNVIGRFGTNYTNNEYYEKHAYSHYDGGQPLELYGYYKNGQSNTWDRTAEFLASYENNLSGIINYKISFGGTHYRRETNYIQGEIRGLHFVDLYNLNNRDYPIRIDNGISKLERNSLYSFINLDYQRKVFLDITGRNDWSSTLHPDNNSFFYPSFTLSALMSDIFELPETINFWKIRASWAKVGKDIPQPYFITADKYYWSTSSETGETYPSPVDYTTDPYLKPELTTGEEIGTDIRLFNSRIELDFTYYTSSTVNQILKTYKSITSGGRQYEMMNAGKISSKGVELTLNTVPVKTNDLEWNLQFNWSLDRTYVDELLVDQPDFNKTQRVNEFIYIEDRVGQRRGTFYGQAYERAPNGERLYSLSGDTRLTERRVLGNYNPDWMASMSNSINYKDFSFSCLFDLRYGGLIYNEIERKLNMYGLSEATLLNDRTGIVPDGMVEEADGTYRKLTLADLEKFGKIGGQSGQEYWATQMEETAPENELIDDTYLKLRELRIAYKLPETWLKKTFIQTATIAVIGRNLAVWSKVKHIDPETFGYAEEGSDFGYGSKVPGYAVSSTPSVRSYGFSLNIKF